MRIPSRILVGCLALLGFGLTAQKADAAYKLDFANTNNSTITFNGTTDTFGFTGPGIAEFSVTGGDGAGLAGIGLNGDITGVYTIGAITVNGAQQSAPVTGTGSFRIFDGTNLFTADVAWVDITTVLGLGGLNASGTVNLTNISYAGSNAALTALVTGTGPSALITFQFNPARSLTQLTTDGATNFTSFSGEVSLESGGGDIPTPAPAGIILLATALPVLGLRRIFRRKTVVA